MTRTIYAMNYARLKALGLLAVSDHARIENGPYMPLSVEVIGAGPDHRILSLAHYGVQNGDLMADPEMTLRVYDDRELVEALTYTNHYVGVRQDVYPEEGMMNLRLKKQLNTFLRSWLINLKDQGFRYAPVPTVPESESADGAVVEGV